MGFPLNVNEKGPSSSALRPPGTMAGFPPPMAFTAAGPLPLLEESPPPPPAAILIPPTLILILGQSLLPGAPDPGAPQLPSLVFLFTPAAPGA